MGRWWATAVVVGLLVGSVSAAWGQPPARGGAEAETEAETEAGTETGTETEAETEPETESGTESEPESGIEAGADDPRTGTETESGAGGGTEMQGEGRTDVSPEAAARSTEPAATTAAPAPAVPPPGLPKKGEKKEDLDAGIPLRVDLHGYYRARLTWLNNLPLCENAPCLQDDAGDAAFAFQRVRLEPHVLYGSNPNKPIAALKLQIDGLDNVVFGDNARIQSTPLFATDPSLTNMEGFELGDSIRLKRAWLEFLIPVGQIRIGRMPSHWGLGILTHDGDGFGEWGDPHFGSTFDRILFATRPITIANALTTGDTSDTPLIFAFVYDKLVEDPIEVSTDPDLKLDPGPLDSRFEARRDGPPIAFLSGNADDVNEVIGVLLWHDPGLKIHKASDELTLGLYFIYRWQNFTDSDVFIPDLHWRFRSGLGPGLPTFYTEGEVLTIQGTSRGVGLTMDCGSGDMPEGVCSETRANIWGATGSIGVEEEDRWGAEIELGWSSGDGNVAPDDKLTMRPFNPDYHVGLLLYQVALAARTANGFGDSFRPLWSRGGVWNSKYIWPQVRYTLLPGIEVHAAFLAAWADELTFQVYANTRDDVLEDSGCGLEGECFLGWETDLALRVKWGENDLLHWDTEIGFMKAGQALSRSHMGVDFGLSEDFLWTVQTRIGMIF